MAVVTEGLYYLLSFPTFRGAFFAGLLLAFVVPALLELVVWRRG